MFGFSSGFMHLHESEKRLFSLISQKVFRVRARIKTDQKNKNVFKTVLEYEKCVQTLLFE